MSRWTILSMGLLATLLLHVPANAQIAAGSAAQRIDLGDLSLDAFTYRPKCSNPNLLLVLHGVSRTAERYRNYARPIADRMCLLIVAPLFDRKRFPGARYQRGGIVESRKVAPPSQWTGNVVPRMVDWVRKAEGTKLDYWLIGHSAGGQFLSRLAAFVPNEARRIVIANPSTHVWPSLQVAAPYGLGGVNADEQAGQSMLRRYLAAPVTIYLGEEDDDPEDDNLAVGKAARAQGADRRERGMNAFKAGKAAAAANKWTFNWRLVELPGIGHSARGMFGAEQAIEALRP